MNVATASPETELLYAVWASSTDDQGRQPEIVGGRLWELVSASSKHIAAYRLVAGGSAMQTYQRTMARLPVSGVKTFHRPESLILAEPASVADCVRIERDLREHANASGLRVFASALYSVVETAPGSVDPDGHFPPAVQLGTFSVSEIEEEWHLLDWYATSRLPELSAVTGCTGAKRLASQAGPGKYGVLYGFASLEDRLQQFEAPLEAKGLDPNWQWRIATITVHTPMSPSIAERVD